MCDSQSLQADTEDAPNRLNTQFKILILPDILSKNKVTGLDIWITHKQKQTFCTTATNDVDSTGTKKTQRDTRCINGDVLINKTDLTNERVSNNILGPIVKEIFQTYAGDKEI